MNKKNNSEAVPIAGVDTRALSNFLIIGGLAIVAPFFIPTQWLSGPFVNFLLVVALFTVGLKGALTLCVIPSLLALAGGLIPPIMAPMLPFIMIGNMLFVKSIDIANSFFKNNDKGYWIGLLIGAFLKFVFLYVSSGLVFSLLIKQDMAGKIAQMMSWPQWLTTLSGGMLAWIFLKKIKRI